MKLYSGIFALLIVFTTIAWKTTEPIAETYKVIKVEGNIVYEKNGNEMTRGDQFLSSEKLKFKNDAARAAVISKSRGRFLLVPKKKASTKVNLIAARSNISMRAGEINNLLDLKKFFSEKIVLLDEMEVKIDLTDFPINESNFFYATYQHNGQEIAKKLASNGKNVQIIRESLFKVDGDAIPVPGLTELTIYHRNTDEKTSKKISTFELASPPLDALKEEVNIIKEEQPKNSENSVFVRAVEGYLSDFYGKVEKDALRKWLSKQGF